MGFYGLAAACVAVLCFVSGVIGYSKGSISRNQEVAEYQAAIKASEILAAEAEARNAKVVEVEVIKYRDRIKVITQKEPGEIQLVEVIRAEANPPLSPAFRLLHDSAASGIKAPEGGPGANDPPVPVEVVAETIRQNYAACRTDQAKLAALQEIIRSQ
jgi:hypothetical protein